MPALGWMGPHLPAPSVDVSAEVISLERLRAEPNSSCFSMRAAVSSKGRHLSTCASARCARSIAAFQSRLQSVSAVCRSRMARKASSLSRLHPNCSQTSANAVSMSEHPAGVRVAVYLLARARRAIACHTPSMPGAMVPSEIQSASEYSWSAIFPSASRRSSICSISTLIVSSNSSSVSGGMGQALASWACESERSVMVHTPVSALPDAASPK